MNVDGYYNSLLTFIDKAVDDGFIMPSQRHIFVSAPNAKELVQKLEVGLLLFSLKRLKTLSSFSLFRVTTIMLFRFCRNTSLWMMGSCPSLGGRWSRSDIILPCKLGLHGSNSSSSSGSSRRKRREGGRGFLGFLQFF